MAPGADQQVAQSDLGAHDLGPGRRRHPLSQAERRPQVALGRCPLAVAGLDETAATLAAAVAPPRGAMKA
jgi:hypothetical protein